MITHNHEIKLKNTKSNFKALVKFDKQQGQEKMTDFSIFRDVNNDKILICHCDDIGQFLLPVKKFHLLDEADKIICCFPSEAAWLNEKYQDKIQYSEHTGMIAISPDTKQMSLFIYYKEK